MIDQSVSIAAIRQTCQDICGDLLVDWQLFDVYQGKGIAEGRRSVAFSFTLQHAAQTLTDVEVTTVVNQLIMELQQRFAAVLRE